MEIPTVVCIFDIWLPEIFGVVSTVLTVLTIYLILVYSPPEMHIFKWFLLAITVLLKVEFFSVLCVVPGFHDVDS